MRGKKIKLLIILFLLLIIGSVVLFSYKSYNSYDWISISPAKSNWAVSAKNDGFIDRNINIYIHNRLKYPFKPKFLCDVFWENKYYPKNVIWSKDGTLVVIAVSFYKNNSNAIIAYHDFKNNLNKLSKKPGSAFAFDKNFSDKVNSLLETRGGILKTEEIPDKM